MARTFVHTHVHSDYSLLDGAAKLQDLVDQAVRHEQPALALTDHGNLCGSIDFYLACRKAGISPLVGIEAYLAPRSRHDRTKNPVAAHHLILLAMDARGWRNLIKLSSRSFTEGFYYFPRIDKELLAAHSDGLIAQSACVSGEPAYYTVHDDIDHAARAAAEMKDIFGDRYYLEVQRNAAQGQLKINQEKVNAAFSRMSRDLGIPLVATQDIHYVHEGDAEAHDVRICIGTGKTVKDDERLKSDSTLCFRGTEDMYGRFADLEEAARNTEVIASRCNLVLDLGKFHLPKFEAPDGEDDVSYFRRLGREGAERRYGAPLSDAVERRLRHEQSVIEQMGFVPYFLITWDFVRYAREQGIPVGPGRGSAAGSLVAYALGITSVDPLAHDLLFERFLNPARISLPDIDIDFCRDGRERVIRYVQARYGGPDRVSQIVTFGRMAARAVIRDVGRVLDVPLRDVDVLAKKVPNGPKDTLRGAMESDPDLRAEVDRDPRYRRLIDVALKLEGMNRNASKHAAGVVIADAPLDEYVPLYRVGNDVTTQFTKTLDAAVAGRLDWAPGIYLRRARCHLSLAASAMQRGEAPAEHLERAETDVTHAARLEPHPSAAGEALRGEILALRAEAEPEEARAHRAAARDAFRVAETRATEERDAWQERIAAVLADEMDMALDDGSVAAAIAALAAQRRDDLAAGRWHPSRAFCERLAALLRAAGREDQAERALVQAADPWA